MTDEQRKQQKNSRNQRADIHAYCHPALKHLAGLAADAQGIPLSELLVKALATYLQAPPEMHKVPRLPQGRKRAHLGTEPLSTPHLWASVAAAKSRVEGQ